MNYFYIRPPKEEENPNAKRTPEMEMQGVSQFRPTATGPKQARPKQLPTRQRRIRRGRAAA